MQIYGNETKCGIHDKKIPTFYQPIASADTTITGDKRDGADTKSSTIEWWKQGPQTDFNPQPDVTSHRVLQQKKKYYAKPDEFYLNEMEEKQAPIDDFKKGRVPSQKVSLVRFEPTPKPNSKHAPETHESMKMLHANMNKSKNRPKAFLTRFSANGLFFKHGPKPSAIDPQDKATPIYSSFDIIRKQQASGEGNGRSMARQERHKAYMANSTLDDKADEFNTASQVGGN